MYALYPAYKTVCFFLSVRFSLFPFLSPSPSLHLSLTILLPFSLTLSPSLYPFFSLSLSPPLLLPHPLPISLSLLFPLPLSQPAITSVHPGRTDRAMSARAKPAHPAPKKPTRRPSTRVECLHAHHAHSLRRSAMLPARPPCFRGREGRGFSSLSSRTAIFRSGRRGGG